MSATLAPVLVGAALRLALGLAIHPPPTWDGELYHLAAQGLASSLGYSCFMFGPGADPSVATAYYPVGLPFYLSLFYRALGPGGLARALAGAIAGGASVLFAQRLAERVAGPRGALLAGWLVALAPGASLHAAAPMSETLWGALLAAAVSAVAAMRAPRLREVSLAGALLAAAAFVRPQALALAPLLPLIAPGSARERVTRALGVTLAVTLLVTPWTLRNCASLDGCAVISTNGASNLAVGAVPRADGRYLALTARDGCGGVYGELARARCWSAVARREIARDPVRWLRLMPAKVWHTWGYEAFPAGYLATARGDLVGPRAEARLRDALTLHWRALALLSLLGLAPLRRRPRLSTEALTLLATLAVITLTHAVFFGGDRYHLPLVPLLAPLAARALTRRADDAESSADASRDSLELQRQRGVGEPPPG